MISHGFIEVRDGVNIAFGKLGTGPHNVLCLPGALGSYRTDFTPQLGMNGGEATSLNSSKMTIVSWDPPGYGSSRPPDRDASIGFYERDADLAHALMQKLGLVPYSLIGWSDGAITSLFIADRYGLESVRKMVLFGGCAFVDEEDVRIYKGLQNIDNWSERMKNPLIDLYGEEYFRNTWHALTDTFIQYGSRPDGNICRDILKNITHPTLLLHGQKDPVVPQHHAQYLQQNIPKSKLLIHPEGKHNFHLRYPEWFKDKAESFLLADDASTAHL